MTRLRLIAGGGCLFGGRGKGIEQSSIKRLISAPYRNDYSQAQRITSLNLDTRADTVIVVCSGSCRCVQNHLGVHGIFRRIVSEYVHTIILACTGPESATLDLNGDCTRRLSAWCPSKSGRGAGAGDAPFSPPPTLGAGFGKDGIPTTASARPTRQRRHGITEQLDERERGQKKKSLINENVTAAR